jgi:hypothetical protein
MRKNRFWGEFALSVLEKRTSFPEAQKELTCVACLNIMNIAHLIFFLIVSIELFVFKTETVFLLRKVGTECLCRYKQFGYTSVFRELKKVLYFVKENVTSIPHRSIERNRKECKFSLRCKIHFKSLSYTGPYSPVDYVSMVV